MKRNLTRIAVALCALPASGIAMAHTGSHPLTGFVSGLTHPLLGPDHLAAMLIIGLLAGIGRHKPWMPLTAFLLCMAGGAAAGMMGIAIAGVEAGIATSVLVLGLLLATMARLPAPSGLLLVGLVALFHGNAHGSEMPLAASPALYGLGFLLSTAALQLAGAGAGRWLRRGRGEWLLRGAGVMAGGFGAWLLLGV